VNAERYASRHAVIPALIAAGRSVSATRRRTIAVTSLPSEPRQISIPRRLVRDIQSAIAEGRRPTPRGSAQIRPFVLTAYNPFGAGESVSRAD
jgi:hypothetical protein